LEKNIEKNIPRKLTEKAIPHQLNRTQKENPNYKKQKDDLMTELEAYFIEPKTTPTDCDRSKELKTFLKKLPI
jgi:hypothetical protein